MKLTEDYIRADSNSKIYNWGNYEVKLKNKYKSEIASEVKTYKWSKEKNEEHLKKIKR